MAVTETTTESWGSRLGGSVKGVLVGLALFIVSFPVLFWNEGNAVKTRRALEEGEGACVSLESNDKVDPDYEGRLVHLTGRADTLDVLTDAEFGVSETAIRLTRKVEMYQWVENRKTVEKKNVGGSVTKTTTYTYTKDWSDEVVDSSGFKEAGHDNPGVFEFASKESLAANVTFGAFRLAENQISSIGGAEACQFATNYVCPVAHAKVVGTVVYVPNAETRGNDLNQRDVAAQPRVGDMRVTFRVVRPHDISVVAKQRGDSFVAYVAKNGRKVQLLADGVKDQTEMFAAAQSANTMMCWFLRLIGFVLMFCGIKMVLKPLSVLGDVLPIVGNIIGVINGVGAFLVALPLTLVTIAIAWVFYRPVLGITLLVLAVGIFGYRVYRRKAAVKPAA